MAAFGTTLQYGAFGPNNTPIVFDVIQTTMFDQKAIYDPTETDYLYTEITIEVKAVLNSNNNPFKTITFGGNNAPAVFMASVRKCLLEPNQLLVYKVGNDVLLQSPSSGIGGSGAPNNAVSEDAKHGPHPLYCNLTQINSTTFLLSYAVTTWIRECCKGGELTPYISNRWSEEHSIDQEMYTTRTVKGRVVFRSDYINSKKFNNGFNQVGDPRNWPKVLIPPALALLPTFVRERMDWTLTEDGLSGEYTIVDKEQYAVPPSGCTRYEASQKLTSVKGAIFEQQFDIKVWGNALTPKQQLLAVASQILVLRLNIFQPGEGWLTKSAQVVFLLHENSVQITLQTFGSLEKQQVIQGVGIVANKGAAFGDLDYIYGGNPQAGRLSKVGGPPDPGLRGTAQLAMTFFQTYLDACTAPGTTPTTVTPPPDKPTAVGNPPPSQPTSVKIVVSLPTLPVPFKAGGGNTPGTPGGGNPGGGGGDFGGPLYTEYTIDAVLSRINHILQIPLAGGIPQSSFAQTAQPTMKKKVRWFVESWGSAPSLPNPESSDPNLILLETKVKPYSLMVSGDGVTPVYTAEGEYEYALLDYTKASYVGGVPPYLSLPVSQSAISSGQFVNGIIDSPGTPPKNGPIMGLID